MRFHALLNPTPGTPTSAFGPYVAQEARKVWEYTKSGVLRELLYTQGSLLPIHSRWECADQEELERLIADFPMVRAGLLQAEIFPLTAYDAIKTLFTTPGPGTPT